MDYKDTLNLPKSIFPMKANLGQNEPKRIKKWQEKKIYFKILEKNKNNPSFILHDGPPYANGHIHIGHALNKILKDIIIKYYALKGYYTPYIPGWDCHGLPIEHKVSQELGPEKLASMPKIKVREKCEKYARKFVRIQKEEFQRLGCLGDWDNPYLTLAPQYEKGILEVFRKIVEKGNLYKSLKPVYWCANCTTALAEAEVEYKDHTSHSIYVAFKVIKGNENISEIENLYFVIWTTTPWTLPANVAICVHPDYEYVIAKEKSGKKYVIAKELIKSFSENCHLDLFVESEFSGRKLEKMLCQHPFIEDRKSMVILGEYVTLEQGTGCVHIAPGHGIEDYEVGKRYNLPIIAPVDDKGRFTDEFEYCKGEHVFKANEKIVKLLKEKGYLLSEGKITHSYPHCWRCKNPIIFRATEQWFISIDENNLRNKAIKEIENVDWIPSWGEDRIKNMVSMRSDWCLSRQRCWGVPIPAFYCKDCGEVLLKPELIDNFIKIVEEKGSNAWFYMEVKELLPEGYKCPKCGSFNIEKEYNILDVWFESGTSHHAVLDLREETSTPADLYLEGSDQHRGWFQSSLLTSILYREKAPFKAVLTHGFLLDGEGKAMHKSAGNAISPLEICNTKGADVLRLWVSSENYQEDVKLSYQILDRMSEAYRKIRNSLRFIVNNLYDFNPEENKIEYSQMPPIDKYMLAKLQILIEKVDEFYKTYKIYKVFHILYNFIITELSAFYLDVAKDRLYTYGKDSLERRSCQTVIYEVLKCISLLLAPILSFTIDEVWEHLPGKKEESVFLENFPQVKKEYIDKTLISDFDILLKIRNLVNKGIEEKRNAKVIGHSLECSITLDFENDNLKKVVEKYLPYLESIFIVSEVKISNLNNYIEDENIIKGVKIYVDKKEGKKCPRCWKRYDESDFPEGSEICKKCIQAIS